MTELFWLAGLFLAWQALVWGWIAVGGTVWKGYKETAVKTHTGPTATPYSQPGIDNGFALNLPFWAQAGEEMVVDYRLDTDVVSSGGMFPVRIKVSCFLGCTANDTRHLTINNGGKGQIAVTLPRSSFYRIQITQTSKHDGRVSFGTYWWGVRAQPLTGPAT